MKRSLLLLLLVVCIFEANNTFAQLSKQEKKEWKKRMKSTDPAEFKNMVEENSSLKGQVSSLNSQISSFQTRISDKDAKISELQDEVTKLEKQLAEAEAAKAVEPEPMDVSPKNQVEKGVVFKVQIGAYKGMDMTKYLDKGEGFSGEVAGDGTQKYTLGSFTDYWEADKFKKYLREMGVKDAWIVPYKDGVRVPMKDVLEGVVN